MTKGCSHFLVASYTLSLFQVYFEPATLPPPGVAATTPGTSCPTLFSLRDRRNRGRGRGAREANPNGVLVAGVPSPLSPSFFLAFLAPLPLPRLRRLYSFRRVCGFFNVPQNFRVEEIVRRDLRLIVLIRKDLKV